MFVFILYYSKSSGNNKNRSVDKKSTEKSDVREKYIAFLLAAQQYNYSIPEGVCKGYYEQKRKFCDIHRIFL